MKHASCDLSALAVVGLGYKSLQNTFFYLGKKRVAEFKIEPKYLRPIYRMSDLDATLFLQGGPASQSLFYCKQKESDLRGTGALNYIRAMANRPAAAKKQSAKPQTISQALMAQSGRHWYSPKAHPHKLHIWIRKAFDAIYAPFLFAKEVGLDQRCNFVRPRAGIDRQCLAAVLSSNLFALAVESVGAASLGAGALELPTKRLRSIQVFDVRCLSRSERRELTRLASRVWKTESPINWAIVDAPGPALRALDEWLLGKIGAGVTPKRLYSDIAETCRARLRLAADKKAKERKTIRQDIDAIANAIAESVRPLLEARLFPEAFFPASARTIHFQFGETKNKLVVRLDPMMSEAVISVRNSRSDQLLLDQSYPRDVAGIIVRSLLMGRTDFKVPAEPSIAATALHEYFGWFPSVLAKIEEPCRSAALGTRYEDQVLYTTLNKLDLHAALLQKEIFGEFNLG